jgi:hypothetical protein
VVPWLEAGRWQAASLAALAGLGLWLAWRRRRTGDAPPGFEAAASDPRLPGTYWLGGGLGLLLFGLLLTSGTGVFFTADAFGQFYDAQASSLLRGRLDVPPEAIGGEAFQLGSASYGYFGLTPALFRLPAVAWDVGWGQWTRLSLLLAAVTALVSAGGILRHWHGIAASRPTRALSFLVGFGLPAGTPLLFLGSRAYVYHEAILWGVALTLASVGCSLRWLARGSERASWVAALILAFLAVNARPSSGLFAAGALAAAAAFRGARVRRAREGRGWREAGVAALALVAGGSFNAVNGLKFGTLEGSPMRLNVQYDAERLARIGHSNFHLVNARFGLETYLGAVPPAFRREFPYVTLQKPRWKEYAGVRIDHVEPTLSLAYSLPWLLAAGLLAAMALRRHPPLRRPAGAVLLGVLPMALALCLATAHSQRYTADFLPFAVTLGTAGLAVLAGWVPGWRRRATTAALALLTLTALAINAAISLHYQGELGWGVPAEHRQHYEALKAWASGGPRLPPQ